MTSTVTDKVTETMAEFYSSTSSDDLPLDVLRTGKRLIKDTLGCIVGGFSMPSSRIINEVISAQGGVPEAAVLVSGVRLPVALASYVNSHMANALDGDDVFLPSSHLAAGLVAPALAVAEREKRSGREFIAAIALGHELAGRINRSLKKVPPSMRQGKGTGSRIYGMGWVSFASTVAAGRLLGLDVEQMRNAFGITAAHTPLPLCGKVSNPKPMSKYAMYGPIGQAGVTAALLAQAGFTADQEIFDGADGLWRMTGETEACNWDELVGELGQRWVLNEVHFKRYPAAWGFKGAIDLIYELQSEESWSPHDVDRVDVYMFPNTLKNHPQVLELGTAVAGCFNLPHLLSCAAFGLPPGPAWHMPETHTDPRLRAFAAKVYAHPWEESARVAAADVAALGHMGRIPTRVAISIGSKRLEADCELQGDAQTPDSNVTDSDLDAKFRSFSVRSLDSDQITEAIAILNDLENQPSIERLVETLVHRHAG